MALVLNGVMSDARVLKEARSLSAAGYVVEVVGIKNTPDILFHRDGDVLVTLLPTCIHATSFAALNDFVRVFLVGGILAVILAIIYWFAPATFQWPATWFSFFSLEITPLTAGIGLGAAALAILLALKYFTALKTGTRHFGRTITYFIKHYWGATKKHDFDLSRDGVGSGRHSRWHLYRGLLNYDTRGWIWRLHGIQRAMYLYAQDRQIDIIHCHDVTTLPVGLALKRRKPGLKLVYDSHELFSAVVADKPQRHAWVKRLESRAAKDIDAAITVNDHIAQTLSQYYPNLPRPTVVCNATLKPEAPVQYDGRLHKAAEVPANARILLYQGGFAPHRGLSELVRAAPLLAEPWVLVMMGSGTYGKSLQNLIKGSGTDKVRFLDAVPQAELPSWTAGAALGAIPYEPVSLNHVFCSPNKLWEYPRSGVPILCSDAPEMTKRVTQYRIGWIIPSHDLTPIGIARIVNSLTPEQLAEAARNCQTFIEADNWSIYEARLLKVYSSLSAREVPRQAHLEK